MSKAKDARLAEAVARVLARCGTYGKLEAAAGVTDRVAWWKGHATEESARAELKRLVEARVRAGEIE